MPADDDALKNSWGHHDLQRVGDRGKKIDCELLVKSPT
jgi:hypothetical protein